MSKIALKLDQNHVSADILVSLQGITTNSLMKIRQSIQTQLPFVEYNLFYNDHIDVASKLKLVTGLLIKNEIAYSIYELEEDKQFEDYSDPNVDKIDYETMINILDSHGSN